MLRLPVIPRRAPGSCGGQGRNQRNGRMDLPGAQVADPALMDFPPFTAIGCRLRRRGIGVFVMAEVSGNRHLLECAIGRGRRKGELKREQQEEEQRD